MNGEARAPYGQLVVYGLVVLAAGAVLDVAFELRRALVALGSWICRTTPTPGGPSACETAFVVRWLTARLPLYVLIAGALAVVVNAGLLGVKTARGSRRFPWHRLLRVLATILCLFALAELIACAGDATCGLSVACT